MSQSFPPMPEPVHRGPAPPHDPTVVVYHEQRSGLPVWAWVVIVLVTLGGVLCIAVCGGLVWLGARSPDIAVVPGRQVPARYKDEIRDLGLIDGSEQIIFFYSDAIMDIKDGMYFFTDQHFVMYSADMSPPELIVPLREIADITYDFSDNWMVDGTIYLTLDDDSEVWFPISPSDGGDQKFYDALVAEWKRRRNE